VPEQGGRFKKEKEGMCILSVYSPVLFELYFRKDMVLSPH
jgi:hypothetical protein